MAFILCGLTGINFWASIMLIMLGMPAMVIGSFGLLVGIAMTIWVIRTVRHGFRRLSAPSFSTPFTVHDGVNPFGD